MTVPPHTTVPEKAEKEFYFDELFMIKSLYNSFAEKRLFFTVSCVDLAVIRCIFQQIMRISFTFDNGF